MALSLKYPLPPMEATPEEELPHGSEWHYEPKWDGFRCLIFRDGKSVRLQSKAEKPLDKYFPELTAALVQLKASRFVLDAEILTVSGSFDELLQRIHPADSRIARLSKETPCVLVVFDMLLDEHGKKLTDLPLLQRRAQLEKFFAKHMDGKSSFQLSPVVRRERDTAAWKKKFKGRLDGIMAKRLDMAYLPGEREAMVKVKHKRTADCIVGGFRYNSKGRGIGSLLLGLYDADSTLHHVGFIAVPKSWDQEELKKRIEPHKTSKSFTGKAPGGPSRWSKGKETEWVPVKPKVVVEVQYDHFSDGRFRHGTKFLRWREDKKPAACDFNQILK